MAIKYLGEEIDIHTGGVDNRFPHHVNEIAQSEAYTGKKFVRYFLHIEHLLVRNFKMSKSLGNSISLLELRSKFHFSIIRFTLIRFHYRDKIFLTENLKIFKESEKMLNRVATFYTFLENFSNQNQNDPIEKDREDLIKNLEEMIKSYDKALKQDLNISKALGIFYKFIRKIYNNVNTLTDIESKTILKEIDKMFFKQLLGYSTLKIWVKDWIALKQSFNMEKLLFDNKIEKEIFDLLKEREKERRNKNYIKADQIRKNIEEYGYTIKDTTQGPMLKKKMNS